MFYINLKPSLENKQIYKVEYLLQCSIVFEVPIPKRDIPQCANCQKYGHTKKFYYLTLRCVKCAKNHTTADCPKKERSANVKYMLYKGNNSVDYKGCAVYKEIQKAKFSALRSK